MEVYICYSFLYLIEALILWQYASNLFHSKYKRWCEGITLACIYTVLLFIFIKQDFLINVLTFLLGNFLFLIIMYQMKWTSALFHAFITTVIMVTSELMVFSAMSHVAPDFFAERTYFRNLMILSVFSKTIYFLVLYFLSRLFRERKEHKIPHDKTSLILTIMPIASLCILMTLYFICLKAELSVLLDWMISISAILVLLINIFIFSLNNYTQRKNIEFTEMQLLLQKEYDASQYYKMLLQQNENQNIIIHDIKNHLQSIASLNQQGESDKINAYIQHIIESSNLNGSIKVCDNDLLNAILCRYLTQCQEHDISFRTDIRSGTADFIDTQDLTTLFCNLLDNAIESAIKMPNSFIELHMSDKQNTTLTLITMTNSCRRNPFSSNSKRLVSNKSNPLRHGFGMKSIERVIAKYQGYMKIYYDEETLTFHTIITLTHP
ncbi:MAG: GHKL domain-containing protein [Lachnospiraceae bacterium]|nr:GHKL domain-containing protein [Lachnospiraceae bacterium]